MKTDNLFLNKIDCCGCGACYAVCPQKAITMEPDNNGFIYPRIDETKCVKCGKCKSVCSYQKYSFITQNNKQKTFAAVAENIDKSLSASGGIFAGIAKWVLEQGGVVFGSAMLHEKNNLTVRHIVIDKVGELSRLQGSKYVQSEIGYSYNEAKQLLEQGQKVLFSGTPCQIAGLYGCLGKTYDNLITIDIVCHGVPSEQFFQSYIELTERKWRKKVKEFRFRDKSKGWRLLGKAVLEKESGKEEKLFTPEESSYYQLFLNGLTYRENCYSCPYAGKYRPADLTIGDYWGIEIVEPGLLTENGGPLSRTEGISCVIVNSKLGEDVLATVPGIVYYESEYEKASRYNGQLKQPFELKPERKTVFEMYSQGYESVEDWYQKRLRKVRMRRAVKKAVPKGIKKFAKRIIAGERN